MALGVGARLGPYEVLSALGAGGMGEVYKARDTRLDRTVAIKILPTDLATDPDLRARFEREARAIAALDHPHICAVHDVGEHDGTRYLVMQYLDGETLAARLARAKGPLPLDQALKVGIEIADALDKAHRAGITHRDLKPANIMLTKSGAKLLDFGLAKLRGPAAPISMSGMTRLATPTPNTAHGTILGTVHYMAPEQVEGREADARADIWALGVVLYEMLTGVRPFDGASAASVIGAILKDRPPSLSTRQPLAPPLLDYLIDRCFEQDPDNRWQSAGDLRSQLAWLAAAISRPRSSSAASGAGRSAWVWGVVAALAVSALASGFVALRHLRETPPAETQVDIVTPATGQPASFALSPDGRQIVFVASDDKASRLWLRLLATTTAQPLGGTEGAANPFWSPDGRSIGFFAGGGLKRLDLGGGAPTTLAPATNGYGGTWNADGVIVFAPSLTSPLLRVSATGGATGAVTTIGAQQAGHFNPQFLPDGRRFLFSASGSATVDGIYLGGLDGTAPTRLVSGRSAGVYAPPGWLLWVRAGELTAQTLDLGRMALAGEPVTLAGGVATDTLRAAVSVASTGLIAYRRASQRQLTWFDRAGTARGVVGEPDESVMAPRVSPDGHRVAVGRVVQGNLDLWLLDGTRSSRFTFDPAREMYPIWSSDGARLVYQSQRTGPGDLYLKPTAGAGAEELLLSTRHMKAPTSWSADGRFLMYVTIDPQTNSDIWILPMSGPAGERKPFVFLNTPFREANAAFSPDSRWVAYDSNESGRPEVYVRPFVPPGAPGIAAAATGQWQISSDGGIMPLWRTDGKELYYLNPEGDMMAVPMTVTGTSLEPGAPVTLFRARIYGGGTDVQSGRQYDVTADGRFLINTTLNEAAAPITLLQNWNPTAKR
jgi:Tol biopolymer transport system component/aminoglycoside phosphotransferase (APT) family kinase protein